MKFYAETGRTASEMNVESQYLPFVADHISAQSIAPISSRIL